MQTHHAFFSGAGIRSAPFFTLFSAPLRSTALLLAVSCLGLAGCASKTPLSDLFGNSPSEQAASAATATTTSTGNSGTNVSSGAPSAAHGSGAKTIEAKGLRGLLGVFAPYRVTIQQGNFVSSEMLTQLKIGMTQDQVRFALGTPLLGDIFHKDRWDYIFRLQRGNGEVTTSRVTVLFKDNVVTGYEGGDLPTETEYLARIAGSAPPAKPLPTLVAPVTAPSSSEVK